MPVVNGTFSASTLQTVQMSIDNEMLKGSVNRLYNNYSPKTFEALRANQMAKVKVIENPAKDQDVKIVWFEQVEGAVAESCVTDCDFTGTGGGTDSQTNSLDACYSTKFQTNSKRQRTNEIDEVTEYAQLFLQNDYYMAKRMNTLAIAFLEANIGTSVFEPASTDSTADGIAVYTAAFDKTLISKMVRSIEMNNLINPVHITGGTFWDIYFNARHEFKNDSGKDKKSLFDELLWYWDLKGLGSDTDQPIYQVSPLAYAFATKVNDTFPKGAPRFVAENIWNYSIESRFMPGVFYQVKENRTCLDAEHVVTDVALELKAKFFLNPKSVNDANNTGIIKWYEHPTS